MTRKPKQATVGERRTTCLSVSKWVDGKAVEWVYVVPAENVMALLRSVSKNPNSQTRSALRKLGLCK